MKFNGLPSENGKINDYTDIEKIYDTETEKAIYDNLNNYHIIYGDDEYVDMETHRDFGCINFEERDNSNIRRIKMCDYCKEKEYDNWKIYRNK